MPPTDFDRYWSAVQEELAQRPVAADLTVMPQHTTDFATVYAVRLTSIGPYRLFAYFSVPRGEGPFPVLYHVPRYGSVNHAPAYEERHHYAVLILCHRGQRLSDQPYAAAYPGLLTDGIDEPNHYVYRGIVADCCRGVDFLLERSEVDAGRISLIGDDLALLTAALRPQIDALYYTPGPFLAAAERAPRTSVYPLEEFNDYARTYPERTGQMWRTLAYFEPLHFASRVQAETILVTGPAGAPALADALGGPVSTYQATASGYRDGIYQAQWLAERYGFAEALVPVQWQ